MECANAADESQEEGVAKVGTSIAVDSADESQAKEAAHLDASIVDDSADESEDGEAAHLDTSMEIRLRNRRPLAQSMLATPSSGAESSSSCGQGLSD